MRLSMVVFVACLIAGCSSKVDNQDSNGNPIRYSDYRGKYLLINYWADWCAPCRREIPELNRLTKERSDLIILGVNYDQPPAHELNEQIKEMGIEFQVLIMDPASQMGFEIPNFLPTSYLLTQDFKLKSTLVGPQTYAAIVALME